MLLSVSEKEVKSQVKKKVEMLSESWKDVRWLVFWTAGTLWVFWKVERW
jgi:hypothetical protein